MNSTGSEDVAQRKLTEVPESVEITPNIKIELIKESHSEKLFQLTDLNRLHLRKWLPWLDSCTRSSDTLNFIQTSNKALSEDRGLTFGIFYKGKIAGTISLDEMDWKDKRAEIGYWIAEEFQGFGIVTMACSTLIDIAFTTLDLEEVYISCASENIKSRKIPLRLSFTSSKFVPNKVNLNGTYVDHYVYTMYKQQWIDMKRKS